MKLVINGYAGAGTCRRWAATTTTAGAAPTGEVKRPSRRIAAWVPVSSTLRTAAYR